MQAAAQSFPVPVRPVQPDSSCKIRTPGCFARSFYMYPAFAEGHESLNSFQNEGKTDGGLLSHFARGLLASGRGILRAAGIAHK